MSPARGRLALFPWGCIVACLLGGPSSAADVKLVDRGAARFVIVIPDQAEEGEQNAAEELRDYVCKATGAAVQIVKETDAKGSLPHELHVGRTSWAKGLKLPLTRLLEDGFVIREEGGKVALTGNSALATEYAGYDFLQRYCGVRWFFPSELGEYVPRSTSLAVPQGTSIVENPDYQGRGLWFGHGKHPEARELDLAWAKRNRLWDLDRKPRYPGTHIFGKILKPSVYGKSHPEYFPLVKGRRFVPPTDTVVGWQPCMSNPEVVQVFADYYIHYFSDNPQAVAQSMLQNDGEGAWCECEKCKALDNPAVKTFQRFDNYADRTCKFIKCVAEKVRVVHPDKLLCAYGYGFTLRAPDDVVLPDNVLAIQVISSSMHWNQEFRDRHYEMIDRWARVASKIGVSDYYFGVGYCIPRPCFHLLEQTLRDVHQKGGVTYGAEVYPHWGFMGPQLYMLARFLWNTRLTADELLDDFCEKMFQESAAPMKRYFLLAERVWTSQTEEPSKFFFWDDPRQLSLYGPETLADCDACFREAYGKAADPQVKKRIDLYNSALRLTKYYCDVYTSQGKIFMDRPSYTDAQLAAKERDVVDLCKTVIEGQRWEDEVLQKDPLLAYRSQRGIFRQRIPVGLLSSAWDAVYPLVDYYQQKNRTGSVQSLVDRVAALGDDHGQFAESYQAFLNQKDSPSLVPNGDFEEGRGPWPDGWRFEPWNGDTKGVWDKTSAYSGSKSFKLVGIAKGYVTDAWSVISPAQRCLACNGFAKVVLKGHYRTKGSQAGVTIYFNDRSWDSQQPYKSSVKHPLAGTDGAWGPLLVCLDIPPGVSFLRINLAAVGRGEVWYDAVELKLLGAPKK